MNRLQAIWNWLAEPSPKVTDLGRRRQSRLLMSLLVVIGVLWVVIFASLPFIAGLQLPSGRRRVVTFIYPLLLLGVALPMAACYFLARSGHPTWAARVLVTVVSAAAFFDIIATSDSNVLSMPVIGLVLCSVLLTPLDTVESFAITVLAYLFVVFGLKLFTLWQIYGALIVVTVAAVLSEVNVVVRARDLKQIDRQAHDLTAYQAELVEAHKMEAVARLSAGLAHELNNTMTAIRGYAEIIKRKSPDSAPVYAERIREASEKAMHLTDGLLSFGQQQLLHLERIDINDLLRQRRAKLGAMLDQTVHLIVRASSESIVVRVDVELICRAMQYILKQEEKHISGPGTIVIRTSSSVLAGRNEFLLPAGDYCIISITDSGAPREAEAIVRLFDPFYTTGEFGTGNLELAAAWGIVRQCRGQVLTKSDATEGNAVQIALPCVPTAAPEE